MRMLYFLTSNTYKIFLAKKNLKPLGIDFEAKPFEIPEIQSDTDTEIATKKAINAFAMLQKPLFVTDDSWYIPSLRGFPGAYMKYMNQWLTPEDFLRLIKPYKNRDIMIRQTLCFTDGKETKVFSQVSTGALLEHPQGKGLPILEISSFSKSGKSVAELVAEDKNPIDNTAVWTDFGTWYLSRNKQGKNLPGL